MMGRGCYLCQMEGSPATFKVLAGASTSLADAMAAETGLTARLCATITTVCNNSYTLPTVIIGATVRDTLGMPKGA